MSAYKLSYKKLKQNRRLGSSNKMQVICSPLRSLNSLLRFSTYPGIIASPVSGKPITASSPKPYMVGKKHHRLNIIKHLSSLIFQ